MSQRDFGNNVAAIPPHGRWRHFDAAGLPRITTLLAKFHADGATPLEAARRLVDLFMISVLLDAGSVQIGHMKSSRLDSRLVVAKD